MEASQTGQSDPQDQPTTASEEQTPAVSQEQPTQDSQLTTPQADQPVPNEADRQVSDPQDQPTTTSEQAVTAEAGPSGEPAEGTVTAPAFPTSAEQQEAHEQRQADTDAQRQLHNERTGGGSVGEGEVKAQRDEHNARVAGESGSDQDQS